MKNTTKKKTEKLMLKTLTYFKTKFKMMRC